MQFLSGQQSHSVDQLAIAEFGMSGLVLMENAGRGVADLLERLGLNCTRGFALLPNLYGKVEC